MPTFCRGLDCLVRWESPSVQVAVAVRPSVHRKCDFGCMHACRARGWLRRDLGRLAKSRSHSRGTRRESWLLGLRCASGGEQVRRRPWVGHHSIGYYCRQTIIWPSGSAGISSCLGQGDLWADRGARPCPHLPPSTNSAYRTRPLWRQP